MPARYGRGGLLPMAVFLTQNSPGLRTSPVKRGNWVVQKVLGIRVPPPPPVVPELPSDESKSDLPVRDMLARHRQNPVCAACHARFDSFGLAFEGYGPVGDARTKDLAGRPVDTSVTYPGGFQGPDWRVSSLYPRTPPKGICKQPQPETAGLRSQPVAATFRRIADRPHGSQLAANEYRFNRWSKRS